MQLQITRSFFIAVISATAVLAGCSSGSDEPIAENSQEVGTVRPNEPTAPLDTDPTTPTEPTTQGPESSPETQTPGPTADDSSNSDYASGAPSNTGIPGAPRARTESFTAMRPEQIDLNYLTHANGFNMRVDSATDDVGRILEALGDVNGDGLTDTLISTKYNAWLIYGSSTNLNDIDFENFDESAGIKLVVGRSYFPAGDVNGDGIADIAWRTYEPSDRSTGIVVVFGRDDDELQASIAALSLGENSIFIQNTQHVNDVRSVVSAGDFNNDGIDDLLIGGYEHDVFDNNSPVGWVVYGDTELVNNSIIDLSELTPGQGLEIVAPLSSEQIDAVYETSLGAFELRTTGGIDFNADGVDDIAIGTKNFDWIANVGSRSTYVIYGGKLHESGQIDLRLLDGDNGIQIYSDPVPYGEQMDEVEAVGDIDGNGFGDLAISNWYNNSIVLFSGTGVTGASVNRSALPAGSSLQLVYSAGGEFDNTRALKVGDIDNDGVDDLGIYVEDEGVTIMYGATDSRPSSLDVSDDNSNTTWVAGSDGNYSFDSRDPLVALGDINNDGVDDLGFSWKYENYEVALREIDDINGDGVADLSAGYLLDGTESQYLLRVLYGYGGDGFTGFLAATPPAEPVTVIEEVVFNDMMGALDLAGQTAISTLNNEVRQNVEANEEVPECLSAVDGLSDGNATQFDCPDSPMQFGYDWGGGKYSGYGYNWILGVAYNNGELVSLNHASNQPQQQVPGASPFNVFFEYDATSTLLMTNGHPEGPMRRECTIDVATRISTDDARACMSHIYDTTRKLKSVYGPDSVVRNFKYLP